METSTNDSLMVVCKMILCAISVDIRAHHRIDLMILIRLHRILKGQITAPWGKV